jgi:sn-glycerol 3-phosphate transport system permease protein
LIDFYPLMFPLLAGTVVGGALVGAWAWRRARFAPATGAIVGGLCGLVGPLLAMKPIRSCTFEAERTGVDRALGVVIFVAGGAILLGASGWVVASIARARGQLAGGQDTFDRGAFRGHRIYPLALLAPTLVILLFFLYRPMVDTLRLSTHTVRITAPRQPFVCLDNYTRLVEPTIEWWAVAPTAALAAALVAELLLNQRHVVNPLLTRLRGLLVVVSVIAWATATFGRRYRGVFTTTTILTTGTVLLSLAVGLAIAVLVSQKIRGRGIYRTLLIWPYAISPPIAGILFFMMFDPLAGIVGHVYEALTPFEIANYRTDPTLARAVVILASVWKTLGFSILFYIAGLQNVAADTLEAAEIDGASRWQRFRHVTVPALAPITFFLVVVNVTYAFFEIFGTTRYLTEGGPSGATTDAMFSLYTAATQQGNFGDGAAQSVILFAMVLAVTGWQFRSTGRRVSYAR